MMLQPSPILNRNQRMWFIFRVVCLITVQQAVTVQEEERLNQNTCQEVLEEACSGDTIPQLQGCCFQASECDTGPSE